MPLLLVLKERNNDPSALAFIGYCYSIGLGFMRNGRKAARYYNRARCLGSTEVDAYEKVSGLTEGMKEEFCALAVDGRGTRGLCL